MKITRVTYYLVERKNSSYPLARVVVVLDDVLKLDGIKIFEGQKGKYIMYPGKYSLDKKLETDSQVKHSNEWYHPVEKEFSDYMERVIIEGYKKSVERGSFRYDPESEEIGLGRKPQRD